MRVYFACAHSGFSISEVSVRSPRQSFNLITWKYVYTGSNYLVNCMLNFENRTTVCAGMKRQGGVDVACTMQHDYLNAYLMLASSSKNLAPVEAILLRYTSVKHASWAPRWAEMAAYVREILSQGSTSPLQTTSHGGTKPFLCSPSILSFPYINNDFLPVDR